MNFAKERKLSITTILLLTSFFYTLLFVVGIVVVVATLYSLLIIVAVIAVVGSLIAYRAIQQAKIPLFVKKARRMKKRNPRNKWIGYSEMSPARARRLV